MSFEGKVPREGVEPPLDRVWAGRLYRWATAAHELGAEGSNLDDLGQSQAACRLAEPPPLEGHTGSQTGRATAVSPAPVLGDCTPPARCPENRRRESNPLLHFGRVACHRGHPDGLRSE